MKPKSTFSKISILLSFSLALLYNNAQGQTFFEITSPAGISGIYDMAAAGFGSPLPGCADMTPISGELIIVDDGVAPVTDGCEAIQNDLTGKIALIDRGTCEFGVKCLNAEDAGAIMVIVCNNQPTDIITMGAGAVGNQVTIPALMISQADCDVIRAEVPGATATVYWEPIVPSDDVVLWDGGQFDGGLGGWTTNALSPDTAFWTWTPDGRSDNGNIVHSPTVCNGAAIFDANVYNAAASGGSPPYPQFAGELISPIIDCSAFEFVSLKFYTHNLRLNGNTFYSYSIDGGNTWSDLVAITTENVFTANETNLVGTEIKRYFIPELAGEPNVQIKFTFNGDFYFFILDDVQLIEPERNNLAVMDNFYAIPPNAVTPYSQVEPFSFLADIANLGAVAQPNTVLNVSIIDNTTSQTVFDENLSYGSVLPGELVENVPFTTYFTPDGSLTTYRGTYHVYSDSVDFDESDNFRYFDLETSDTTFAKENGATTSVTPAAASWEGENEPHSWAFGNSYFVVNGSPDWYASSATFAIGAPAPELVGRLISVYLYRWNADTNEDASMDPEERTRIAFNVYEITGDEGQADLITIPLLSYPTGGPGPIALDDNTTYALMVEYLTNDEVNFFMAGAEYNYAAMVFRSDLDGPDAARFGYLLGVNGDLDVEPYASAGFSNPIAPVVRLNITQFSSVEEPLDENNIVEISPNPADNQINVKIDLVETHEHANVRIFDVNGRLMQEKQFDNVQNEMLSFDVSAFANGAYFLRYTSEKGSRSVRFIVQH